MIKGSKVSGSAFRGCERRNSMFRTMGFRRFPDSPYRLWRRGPGL